MAAPYALPPLQEQLRIVAEIEKLLSTVEDIAMSCDLGNKRSNVFRSAVLRNAFSGKLVPQDPNDEPASVLLERIRAERARASKDKTPKATNRAMHLDGQRRRRVKKLAPGVSPEKPSKNNSSAVGAAQKGEYA